MGRKRKRSGTSRSLVGHFRMLTFIVDIHWVSGCGYFYLDAVVWCCNGFTRLCSPLYNTCIAMLWMQSGSFLKRIIRTDIQ